MMNFKKATHLGGFFIIIGLGYSINGDEMNISIYKTSQAQLIEWTWYRPGLRSTLVFLFTLALDALVIYFGYKLLVAGQYSSK